jgi:hypothetical protein
MSPYQDLVPLSYQSLTTRRRQYVEWILVDHRDMCMLPLNRIDVGNALFDRLMKSTNSRTLPPGAVVVMVSIEAIVVLDYKIASVVLK